MALHGEPQESAVVEVWPLQGKTWDSQANILAVGASGTVPARQRLGIERSGLWTGVSRVRFRPDSFRGGNEGEWAGMRKAMYVHTRQLRSMMEYLPSVGVHRLEGTTALFISSSVDGYISRWCPHQRCSSDRSKPRFETDGLQCAGPSTAELRENVLG
jgi:hypothetical protein